MLAVSLRIVWEPLASDLCITIRSDCVVRYQDISIEEVRMFQAAVRLEYISIEYSYRTSVLFCWFPELRYEFLGIVWGIRNLTVRAAILGFIKTGLLRKPLPGMFSLIKSER